MKEDTVRGMDRSFGAPASHIACVKSTDWEEGTHRLRMMEREVQSYRWAVWAFGERTVCIRGEGVFVT